LWLANVEATILPEQNPEERIIINAADLGGVGASFKEFWINDAQVRNCR
jgi:hypothetical protein